MRARSQPCVSVVSASAPPPRRWHWRSSGVPTTDDRCVCFFGLGAELPKLLLRVWPSGAGCQRLSFSENGAMFNRVLLRQRSSGGPGSATATRQRHVQGPARSLLRSSADPARNSFRACSAAGGATPCGCFGARTLWGTPTRACELRASSPQPSGRTSASESQRCGCGGRPSGAQGPGQTRRPACIGLQHGRGCHGCMIKI